MKQAHHDDIVIFTSLLNSESIYHVNTFHMYTMINAYSCCLCKIAFRFNNKLYQHIQFIHSKIKIRKLFLNSESELKLILVSKLTIIHVDAYYMIIDIVELDTINIVNESGCEFYNWHYMMIFFQFKFHEGFIESVCLNIKCTMSLIDKQFLHQHLLNLLIQKSMIKMTVCNIENKIHECQKYVYLNLYLSNVLIKKINLVHIICNIYLVDNLQTNILINMNIIESKWINIDILSQKIIIREC